ERIFVRVEPIMDNEENVQGVIYLEASLENEYGQFQDVNEIIFKGSIIALIVSVILGILVARAITKPIVEMRRHALTLSSGYFTQKVQVYGTYGISQLVVTF